jgi:hypothetical protein
VTLEPFLDGDLLSVLRRMDDHWGWDDWKYREDFERQLERALATRYVGVYHCDERDDSDESYEGCVVWLADVPAARVLLRKPMVTLSTNSFNVGDEMLGELAQATGGTFQREGD